MNIACVAVPRFKLLAATGGRRELLRGTVALAPEPGGARAVGEASEAAEGVRSGMRLGEALARCPELRLLPPDPGAAAELWEDALRRLEEIGAAVESERPGEAFFAVDGLRGIHGGVKGVAAAARTAMPMPARIGVGPTRLAAFAAGDSTIGRAELRRFLADLPASILIPRLAPPQPPAEELVLTLSRLGIRSLGSLAALPEADVADRFGPLGLHAHGLARGHDEPLRPRRPCEEVTASIDLPEACGGEQLERALRLLVDRLLAMPERRRRAVLALRLGAKLAGGGSWGEDIALSHPNASPEAMHAVLSPRLERLPAPAGTLTLRATSLCGCGGEQLELSCRGDEQRRSRLAEATRQVRALQGPEALLKILDVDSTSRVPERRTALTSF
jgi:protein ImuB